MMAFAISSTIALGVAVFARVSRFDRDRAFYPTVLMVTASYYVLFAVLGDSMPALVIDGVGLIAFTAAAVLGVRNQSIVALGLAAHGVLDVFHGHLVANPGVPEWWPAFCLGFDVGAAAWLLFSARRAPATVFAKLVEAQ